MFKKLVKGLCKLACCTVACGLGTMEILSGGLLIFHSVKHFFGY